MDSHFKLLHCLKEISYLHSSLSNGLMFRDHTVKFSPISDNSDMEVLLNQIRPILERHLRNIGKPFESLSEVRKKVIYMGLGTISSEIPMLCFSEAPKSRDITNHRALFGNYGLVIRNSWAVQNQADRVVYVGHNSPFSQKLFLNLAFMRLKSLYLNSDGEVLFDNDAIRFALDLFVYFEERDHLNEMEWRIVGNPGFMGGNRQTGNRLPLPIESVEFVFVSDKSEIPETRALVNSLAITQKASQQPYIIPFPDHIPYYSLI